MIIRSALLEGMVPAADQAEFDHYMRGTVAREILTYPGIRRVVLRKLVHADESATPIYMQFDLHFDSVDAMNEALASPVRQAVQMRIKAGMGPFSGRVTHIVSEVLEDHA